MCKPSFAILFVLALALLTQPRAWAEESSAGSEIKQSGSTAGIESKEASVTRPADNAGQNANAPQADSGAGNSSQSAQTDIPAASAQPTGAGQLAPGPLLGRRAEILNFLNKAKHAGIGVKPYEDALASIEADVKAGKTEAEIRPRCNSLVLALTKQVENLKMIKAVQANKAVEDALAAQSGGGSPLMGTPQSNSGFGFENGVFKIKPLARTTAGLLAGVSPEYQKYAHVLGREVPVSILERLLFDLTNKHRKEMKLPPYSYNSRLASLARSHVNDMVTQDFYGHVNKERKGPYERAAEAGFKVSVRENIGMAGAGRGTPIGMIILIDDGLMRSPGHRAAILDPNGRGAGMGVAYDLKNGGIKACQEFSPTDF
jgi:uncharacterized protein YkwD